MAEVKYRIAGNGEPTAKWVASAQAGAGIGLPLGIVVAYLVAYAFPAMPQEVQVAVVAVIMWATTQAATMLAGYYRRPAAKDRPEIDPTVATPPPSGGIPE